MGLLTAAALVGALFVFVTVSAAAECRCRRRRWRPKRFDKWIIIGPGGGGAQFHPNVSPHDPKDVLNSTDMSEAYVSHDGGESWRQFNVRGHTRFIVWDPIDPKTAYIKTLALFRTTDRARTWQLVHPAPPASSASPPSATTASSASSPEDGFDDRDRRRWP